MKYLKKRSTKRRYKSRSRSCRNKRTYKTRTCRKRRVMKGVMKGGWGFSVNTPAVLKPFIEDQTDEDEEVNFVGGGWVTIAQ